MLRGAESLSQAPSRRTDPRCSGQAWEAKFFDWWAAANPAGVIRVEAVPSVRGNFAACPKLKVWVQPGGNAYHQQTALGSEGRSILRGPVVA